MKRLLRNTLSLSIFFCVNTSFAQHDMGNNTMKMEKDSMQMTSAFSLNLPMNRNSSGTAWQPDATPMYGYMIKAGKWNLMLHGSIFLRYNYQKASSVGTNASRSDSLTDRIDAPNWLMLMVNRKIAKRGLLSINIMLSADELIMGGNGYPLLFQTGETYQNKPLVDRQHPHDFISGLSIAYTHMLNKNIDISDFRENPQSVHQHSCTEFSLSIIPMRL